MSRVACLGVLCAALAACGADSHPTLDAGDGADSEVQPADASAVQAASVDGGDAALPTRDASALDAASLPDDAQSPASDAAASCNIAPATPVCESRLCSVAGGTWLAVRAEQPWQVGGLDWLLAICQRPGDEWPRGRSADGLELGFRLRANDLAELQAGAAVQLYWGSPGTAPGQSKRCSFQASETLPACPFEGHCTAQRKDEVAALEPRPECLPCAGDAGLDPCFGVGSCACWCAIREGLRDACPGLVP